MSRFSNLLGSDATVAESRRAAVAGAFYPAQPQQLRAEVEGYLAAATLPEIAGKVRAVIAPHAGYIYSGPIAGYSFRALDLRPGHEHTIFLLGPPHRVYVTGVGAGYYRWLETPLGRLPVALEIIEQLVEGGSIFHARNGAHAPEHGLEVELPFLQVIAASELRIVPLLLGDVDAQVVAEALLPFIVDDPDARLVISSDLSHFHPYDQAQALDSATLNAIISGEMHVLDGDRACGYKSILTLMHLARHLGWQPHLLDYRNSGDTAGDRARVVGYGAVAYAEV